MEGNVGIGLLIGLLVTTGRAKRERVDPAAGPAGRGSRGQRGQLRPWTSAPVATRVRIPAPRRPVDG